MNFFKKISPKFVVFLIFVYLSFVLIGCPSAPYTKPVEVTEETTEIKTEETEAVRETDKALIKFWDTYDSFVELDNKARDLWDKYNETLEKVNLIRDDLLGLTTREKEKIGKLGQKGLNVITEQQEIIDKIREVIYEKGDIISDLQGNVTKITDPSKKLLAQEIADNLRETNNLESEELGLRDTLNRYDYSYFKDALFVSQGKMTMEESNKRVEDLDDDIKESLDKLDEIFNDINALIGKCSDLAAKLDSLGLYK